MDLSIKALTAAGAFVAPPVKKDITWHAGGKVQKASIYVRQESFVELTEGWKNEGQGADRLAARIASNILKKDGTPVFTVEDVLGSESSGHGPLSAELTIVLLNAISEANGAVKEDQPKK
ncbi:MULTISPECIES: phage tail assembly chaperone family protein, TAC [Pseudomonas]|uniref:Phage tail assembly chaperone family protein, TAC n=1 Tax=Pseudomonas fitomaticsae TaxID=2837969 RepID=A0ABY3PXT1_9PSED|nr:MULTISPECIES: phage tail assembly chaperone family protein, TAC [Pseudomonas]UFP98549.1 phage tail assembly chaperone family protein, TAC [Pseudomonas fitomaticsae]